MSYLEAFPAKTSVAPAKVQASKESDLPCGRTWRESLEKFDLNTHTWKTHQCLWDEDLQPSSVILPKWGMMLSGVLWESTTSGLPTSETGSGLLESWPTPKAQESKHGEPTDWEMQTDHEGTKFSLRVQVAKREQKWPTPSANKTTSSGELVNADGTPWDGHSKPHSAQTGKPVQTALMDKVIQQKWPTPKSSEYKGAALDRIPDTDQYRGNLCEKAELETGEPQRENGKVKRLNPDWVEWLMGWPIGWTSIEEITELDWRDWSVDPADELQPRGTNTEGLIPTPSSSETGLRNKNYAQGGQSIGVAIRELGVGEGSVPRVTAGTKHRIGRLKAIGNGQCPQAAALAWTILSKAE